MPSQKFYAEIFGESDLNIRVREYQRSVGLTPDGKIGPKTLARLYRSGFSETACPPIIKEPPRLDRGLLIIRGLYLGATRRHPLEHAPRYDDTFILYDNGVIQAKFAGASHAYQLYSKAAPDVNRDSLGDVGSIRCGEYLLDPAAKVPPIWRVLRTDGSPCLPADRDVDHDGIISPEEEELSKSLVKGPQVTPGIGAFATAVLVHPGYTNRQPNGIPYSSIGCITAPAADLGRLWQTVGTGKPKLPLKIISALDLCG